ncbi:TIR domain-containing protein [Vibrio cholerae]|uniref:toll/interleukin-1 receptor domain-containing protein n=1 Tax=Vibrio cholerae TaxID=666 RepID=UPI001DA17867|nr:TIR domain-containing protein [Vibrio cholerae]EGR4299691.1 TIR domain-containing protein [Vibrio cholerae]EJL7978767.1 toll/interleukin-1 receptor domain-containing protein [Vibrio cholerae]
MATIREYYDTDFTYMSVGGTWSISRPDGSYTISIDVKIMQAFEANAKFWTVYVPDGTDCLGLITSLLQAPLIHKAHLSEEGDGLDIQMGFGNYSERMSSQTLMFTKRVFIYVDELLNVKQREELRKFASQLSIDLILRDREYAMERSKLEKPLAFISHDSRDKDELVRALALEMSKLMCPVWYDEYSLKVGDSLRENIEAGLKETQKCIVVLSPNFLSNEGWGKAEFDSIFTREILEKKNVILPIWHNVGVEDVYQYSPRLADKVGLSSGMGVEELARKLVHVIKNT